MSTAIKAENLSKAYQLGQIGTGTLSRDLERSWAKLRGKEDPFLKIGEANDRSTKGTSDIVWSLKDINFDIQQGDAVGIIGRNGAGKSTLLKVLSRVTSPTTGSVKVKGRIASLLEVGTGFHPELTGRENIYLNGAILGMRKKEITRKFDEIVDFAGVERYIDTPVKRYSSGMYVRLAFAVAAHLESEILIVDEVLAVGDAEFQKKCLGKMGDVSKGEGRTVLFVSHNMSSVKQLCNTGIYLKNGTIRSIDDIEPIVEFYQADTIEKEIIPVDEIKRPDHLGNEVKITNIRMYNEMHQSTDTLHFNEKMCFDIDITSSIDIKELNIGLRFETSNDTYISSTLSGDSQMHFNMQQKGTITIRCNIDSFKLNPGNYFITASIRKDNIFYDQVAKCFRINVLDYARDSETQYNKAWGLIKINSEWGLI